MYPGKCLWKVYLVSKTSWGRGEELGKQDWEIVGDEIKCNVLYDHLHFTTLHSRPLHLAIGFHSSALPLCKLLTSEIGMGRGDCFTSIFLILWSTSIGARPFFPLHSKTLHSSDFFFFFSSFFHDTSRHQSCCSSRLWAKWSTKLQLCEPRPPQCCSPGW